MFHQQHHKLGPFIKAMGSCQTALLPQAFPGFRTAPSWPAGSYSLLSWLFPALRAQMIALPKTRSSS